MLPKACYVLMFVYLYIQMLNVMAEEMGFERSVDRQGPECGGPTRDWCSYKSNGRVLSQSTGKEFWVAHWGHTRETNVCKHGGSSAGPEYTSPSFICCFCISIAGERVRVTNTLNESATPSLSPWAQILNPPWLWGTDGYYYLLY